LGHIKVDSDVVPSVWHKGHKPDIATIIDVAIIPTIDIAVAIKASLCPMVDLWRD